MEAISMWFKLMLIRIVQVGLMLVGAFALTIWTLQAAFGSEMRTIAGLFCDTQEQMTEVFNRINAKEHPQFVISDVNARAEKPNACAVIRNMALIMTDFALKGTEKVDEQVFYFYSGRVIGIKLLDGSVTEASGETQFFILTEPLIAAHKVRSI